MEKFPMTSTGFKRLEEELKTLKETERPIVIEAIAEAREHGDLKENAEYHAAREKQGFIEGRIQELEAKISMAEIFDIAKMSGTTVKFGATVTLADENTDEETTWKIVGEDEADIAKNLISYKSPMARALIGKEVNDSAEVKTPRGMRSYEVIKVEYK